MLLTSIRLAIRGLNRNKLRTILTMLGMIIGVAAVMTMVALGNGAQQSVEQEVRSAGTSLIHVNAGNYTRGGEESKIATGLGSATTLLPADAAAVGSGVPGLKALAPGVKLRGWVASGGRRFYGQVFGFAGLSRDWSMPDDWHRGYLHGRLAAKRFHRAITPVVESLGLLANAIGSVSAAFIQRLRDAASEAVGEEQELTAEQLRGIVGSACEPNRRIRFTAEGGFSEN